MDHPAVLQAAAIGVPDEKWGERAVLVVALQPGSHVDEADVLALYKGRVARWCVPERIVVDALPVGATGKVQKNKLREIYRAAELAAGDAASLDSSLSGWRYTGNAAVLPVARWGPGYVPTERSARRWTG